jgi:hypothetical protein
MPMSGNDIVFAALDQRAATLTALLPKTASALSSAGVVLLWLTQTQEFVAPYHGLRLPRFTRLVI